MEKLEKFWLLVVDVWQKGLFGIQIDRLVIALAILLGFLIVRRLFTHIVIGRAKAWVAKSDGRLDNSILEALTSSGASDDQGFNNFFSSNPTIFCPNKPQVIYRIPHPSARRHMLQPDPYS